MKKKICCFLIPLFLLLSMAMTVCAGAATQKEKALAAYADMLAAMPKATRFVTALVDNNSVPELFIRDVQGIHTMYRWNGKSVVGVQFGDERVESYGAVLSVYYKKSMIMMKDVHGLTTYASYAKGELSAVLHMGNTSMGYRYQDVVDHVADVISLMKFNEILGEKVGLTKCSTLKYVTNTAAHRKSKLKTKGTAASVKLNSASLLLTAGKSKTLKATVTGTENKVKWASSDKTVASVTSKGKVKAVGAGNCLITATCGKLQAVCRVRVKAKKLFPEVDEVKLIRHLDTVDKVWFSLRAVGEGGKAVWESDYTSGITHEPGQIAALQFIESGRYVYLYENGYFVKLERETGQVLAMSQKELPMGPPSLYVDSYGTLFAVPIDGENKMYMLSSELELLREQEFLLSEIIGGKIIRGRTGNYLVISSEGSDAAVAVYLY